jgi:hypothetical protein
MKKKREEATQKKLKLMVQGAASKLPFLYGYIDLKKEVILPHLDNRKQPTWIFITRKQ